jgi:hypothetical protein
MARIDKSLIEDLNELVNDYGPDSEEGYLLSIFRDITVKLRREGDISRYIKELEDIYYN